jgi:vitamin B12 transporter
MKQATAALTLCAALLAGTDTLAARQAQPPDLAAARAALEECAAMAASLEGNSAAQAGARTSYENARRLFRQAVSAQPPSAEGHAGLGETVARCGIPLAGMATIMAVVEEAVASLETALSLEPRHWQARFTLALVNARLPAMMGRKSVAIAHLETLLEQQGGRAEPSHYALTYLHLGDAYIASGRVADGQATHRAGAQLFPAHEALQQRAHAAGPERDAAERARQQDAQPPVYAMPPLRVEASQHQLEEARGGTALRRIDVYTMPGGTGEMLQTLQTLPGVTRAGDGADLYVRGGDPEETPVFVNGGRLAFPGRWESLDGSTMGVLEASVLARAFFSAGGFSARFGNALAGVVDVETIGRPAEPRGRVGANIVSFGASLFRPAGSAAGAWGSFMLTDVRLLAAAQGQGDTYPDAPQSYQLVAGGAIVLAPRVELKAAALASGDRSSRRIHAGGHSGPFASAGSTQHVSVSTRWAATDGRAGVQVALTGSRRGGGYRFGVLARERQDVAYGARIEGDGVAPTGTRLRVGAEAALFDATTAGAVPVTGNLHPGAPVRVLDAEHTDAWHGGAFMEAEHAFGPLAVALGARLDRLPGEAAATADPRAALALSLDGWVLRAAGGVFHQGRWRRSYRLPDSGSPEGVPTRARQLVAGAERGGEPAVRLEAWARWYDGYRPAESGALDIAGGTARGADAIVRWSRQERLNGWITYSLLDATLDLLDGAVARARYDVTHTLTGVARLSLGEQWEAGSTLRYATGRPYTPVIGTEPPSQDGWPVRPAFGEAHSGRVPDYFRVDVRITRYLRFGERRMGVFYLEVLDLNGRANVVGYQYDATYTERNPVESFFSRRSFVLGADVSF